ncbi:unnamed protein product [Symbiodinium sp. CCMP2592]|nr:unnamed protein product [Symbiodinium sp. CCMP2592]
MAFWRFLVLAALGSSSTEPEQAPCASSSILRMIRDFAPECISSCPAVCLPLESLISSVMMGQDPFLTICPNWQTFYCMALPDVLESCTPLLDAAKTYVGINLPRSGEQLMEVCEVSSTSTTTLGTQVMSVTSTSTLSQKLAGTGTTSTTATATATVATSTPATSGTSLTATATATATVTVTSPSSSVSASSTSSDPAEQEHALLNRAPDSLSISQGRAAEPTEQTSTERGQNESEEALNTSENVSEEFDDFRDGYVIDGSCAPSAFWALLMLALASAAAS